MLKFRLTVVCLLVACSPSPEADNPDAAVADAAMDDAAPACPSGLADRFECDGDRRIRCVDGALQAVACPDGCMAGTGGNDATCACGAVSSQRWTCGSDGDLHSCAGGITQLAESCDGRGCTAPSGSMSATCKSASGSTLQAALDQLGPLCGQYSPGTTCGLAVRDLVTGETAQYRGNAFYVSASSAKAVWVAAALYDTSILAVMPFAIPVFRDSDNAASGDVIDLLVSPDRINTFMWNDVGVPDSGFCHWNYNKTREASNCPPVKGSSNFFSANDMLHFVGVLWDRSLLGDARATAELSWMQMSPRTGYGGWLGTQLPASARASMHHKAGWLPPSEVPGYSNSNEIGIVEIPGGHAYGVAILMNGGSDYDHKQLPMMEFASCFIYHAVAGDAATSCTHP